MTTYSLWTDDLGQGEWVAGPGGVRRWVPAGVDRNPALAARHAIVERAAANIMERFRCTYTEAYVQACLALRAAGIRDHD